jgi:hypothetical protein
MVASGALLVAVPVNEADEEDEATAAFALTDPVSGVLGDCDGPLAHGGELREV